MPAPETVYCPVCNAQGSEPRVLSPMVASHVLIAPIDGPEDERPPYYSYRCQRCGFAEIHKHRIGVR